MATKVFAPYPEDRPATPGSAPARSFVASEPLSDEHAMASREKAIHDVLAADEVQQAYLARMLHDSVGQNVAALLLGFKELERQLDGREDAKLTMRSLHAITQSIGQELHQFALDLRPSGLDDHGLPRALATVLDEWSVIEKVRIDFDGFSPAEPRLSRRTEATLFRIVRHALHYVAKSPHGDRMSVILQRNTHCVTIVLESTGDALPGNGREGLTPEWHLQAMTAHLSLVGGTLAVEPHCPHGLAIFVRLPLLAEHAP